MSRLVSTIAMGTSLASAAATGYSVPKTLPSNAAAVDPTPVGPSFEFFMWPSYMRNITPALDCLGHFDDIYGQRMPIRIGGTTQDRASYDPDLEAYVNYHVDDPLDAPMALTYGPKFFDLISEFGAPTTIGINRALNNRTNTFAATAELKKRAVKYIDAIEIGNEPDIYLEFWNYPVATAPWNETQEGADAADWAQDFANRWEEPLPILAAGGYAIPFPYKPNWPNLPYLIDVAYNESVKAATKEYNGHLYAFSDADQNDLQHEMQHQRVVADLGVLPIATALGDGKPYIIGETGFHGMDFVMDQQFGGAIQIVDKTLLALSKGVSRLFYHQGTINQAFFNWWYNDQVNTPFYGGYVSALATQGADHIIAADDGTSLFAQYVLYKNGSPFKIVLVNTDFYDGKGKRASHTYELKDLAACKIEAVRMTAPSSYTETTRDQKKPSLEPTIGGQYFSNKDCSLKGKAKKEKVSVKDGKASIKVYASEVVILYLK